jgi:hypothetical protein
MIGRKVCRKEKEHKKGKNRAYRVEEELNRPNRMLNRRVN